MFNYQGLGTYKRTTTGRFDSFKAKIVRAFKFLVRWSLISAAAYAIFMAGALTYSTSEVLASEPVVVEAPSPIMDRIADCESGNGTAGSARQLKNGQTIVSLNTNGTYDIGKYQINSIHNIEATKLGFNLATEEGNTGYAKYLYQNRGTGDWASSAHCWTR